MASGEFQQVLLDLLLSLQDLSENVSELTCPRKFQEIVHKLQGFLAKCEATMGAMEQWKHLERESSFTREWACLAWALVAVAPRIERLYFAGIHSVAQFADTWNALLGQHNAVLVQLVNCAKPIAPPDGVSKTDPLFEQFSVNFGATLISLHELYSAMPTLGEQQLSSQIQQLGNTHLDACLKALQDQYNQLVLPCAERIRQAQINRMMMLCGYPEDEMQLMRLYNENFAYALGILAARFIGFRHQAVNGLGLFAHFDPMQPLLGAVHTTLELCLADSVVATEPSTDAILVTNNLFAVTSITLTRGFALRDVVVQIVSHETAEVIQSDLRRQRLLQHLCLPIDYPSAATLAMKANIGLKRNATDSARKKPDAFSKAAGNAVKIPLHFDATSRSWCATFPHLVCTARQKELSSGSFEANGESDRKLTHIGKRDIFYFYFRATVFSPSGQLCPVRTLSVPFTIATRRNQDCQVQRMMSSYTATTYWLYGHGKQDGLLLKWPDYGMPWEQFKVTCNQYFKVNAEVSRGLTDQDFALLQWKVVCKECAGASGTQGAVTFRCLLCPHLKYESGATSIRFSVWRGILQLLQIFQDEKTHVRDLWNKGLVFGFAQLHQVSDFLRGQPEPSILMRLTMVGGGAICMAVKSNAFGQEPVHLEPLDFKRLQQKSLVEYLYDISTAEGIRSILTVSGQRMEVADVLGKYGVRAAADTMRDVTTNADHSGCIDSLHQLRFRAMRIAVITCKHGAPDGTDDDPQTAGNDTDFVEDLRQLMVRHAKSHADVLTALNALPENEPQSPF